MPTIVPLTSETKWLPKLQHLPNWEPPLIPTLVLAPHPDDETLGAGGLIARLCRQGVTVIVVAVTDGENAYSDTQNMGDIRVQEQVEALHRLGVPESMVRRLCLPDRDVSACEDRLVDLLLPMIKGEMHLVAPWKRDFHTDHEAVGRAAARVAQIKSVPLTSYLFWTWHRGVPDMLEGLSVEKVSLTDAELQIKRHALEAHASQFEHADGQPILSPELLMPTQRAYEVYIR
ncbi:PIG-L family deacetylase [Tunturiibacter empetritectus]|uniref:LmbE family N-acetylglucosaminyl deacetylase n=1 Tax=Tunturiibacter lichenicola TaxID=2051959 RepID=A0A852V764_9BACT|nr:PIG-L family deacetylase [Edaphobacter lichenicola]NYF88753.1 LmbE family N-acetylglucosaminyl deacetylase [Edaphobacter lichenicola]